MTARLCSLCNNLLSLLHNVMYNTLELLSSEVEAGDNTGGTEGMETKLPSNMKEFMLGKKKKNYLFREVKFFLLRPPFGAPFQSLNFSGSVFPVPRIMFNHR